MGATPVFETQPDAEGRLCIVKEHDLDGDRLLVEIPPSLAELKAADLELARAWRARTRALFQRAFAAGYVASDLVMTRTPRRRAAYVLTREPIETEV
jgi:predicted GNAT superfamily acetyltransferase